MQARANSFVASLLILLVRLYRNTMAQFMLGACRFLPSCSEYAEEALKEHGTIHGGRRALWRLLRCHPFSRGGWDPVG